jgi:hypothetical protein
MKNYTKYLIAPGKEKMVFNDARDFFNFKAFRQYKDAVKDNTFIYKLTETTLFTNFIESRSFGVCEHDAEIIFFDEALKEKRTKKRP